MVSDKNFEEVEVGKTYVRRDGKKAFCFNFDIISRNYNCVVIGTVSFFSVNEDGQYLQSCIDCNDLVKVL